MMYELWDLDSRNVIRFFGTAAEADDVLSASVRKSGPGILRGLALFHEDEHEYSEVIAEGHAILDTVKRLRSAEAAHSTPSPTPGRCLG